MKLLWSYRLKGGASLRTEEPFGSYRWDFELFFLVAAWVTRRWWLWAVGVSSCEGRCLLGDGSRGKSRSWRSWNSWSDSIFRGTSCINLLMTPPSRPHPNPQECFDVAPPTTLPLRSGLADESPAPPPLLHLWVRAQRGGWGSVRCEVVWILDLVLHYNEGGGRGGFSKQAECAGMSHHAPDGVLLLETTTRFGPPGQRGGQGSDQGPADPPNLIGFRFMTSQKKLWCSDPRRMIEKWDED